MGRSPAPILAPGRHDALGPGPTGSLGLPLRPVALSLRWGRRPLRPGPGRPPPLRGPQGLGWAPRRRAAGVGGGGLARGGQAPGVSMARGAAGPPPQPASGRPPFLRLPPPGGLRCGPADAAGRGPPAPHAPFLRLLLLSASPRHLVLSLRHADITIRGDSGPFPS